MPKRDARFMQKQRERVLDAAYACFLQKGFRDTSIRDICKESNLSIGAIYVHFESRETIIGEVCKRISAQTAGNTPTDASVEEFVSDIVDLTVTCLKNAAMTDLNHQLIADALSMQQMADIYRELMTYSTDWMRSHIERFHLSRQIKLPNDIDTTVQGLASLLAGFSLRLHFEPQQSERVASAQLRALVTQLIGAPNLAVVGKSSAG